MDADPRNGTKEKQVFLGIKTKKKEKFRTIVKIL